MIARFPNPPLFYDLRAIMHLSRLGEIFDAASPSAPQGEASKLQSIGVKVYAHAQGAPERTLEKGLQPGSGEMDAAAGVTATQRRLIGALWLTVGLIGSVSV